MRFDCLYCTRHCAWGCIIGLSLRVDIILFFGSAAGYALNKCLIKPLGLFFFNCYFNDILAGILFPAYANILLHFAQKRMTWPIVLLFMLFWGIFWEYAVPLFVRTATSDVWDLAAYEAGALFYILTAGMICSLKPFQKKEEGNGEKYCPPFE